MNSKGGGGELSVVTIITLLLSVIDINYVDMQLCLLITNGWLEVRKAAYPLVQRSKERGNKRERERERERERRKGGESTVQGLH